MNGWLDLDHGNRQSRGMVGWLGSCYLGWSLCTLYLLIYWVRVTVGDLGLCCAHVMSFFETLINSFRMQKKKTLQGIA